MRVSIICSSGTGPRACGAAPASLRAGAGSGQGQGQGAVAFGAGARWSPGPCAGHRYWGEKEEGKCILFVFRSADHCESCPLSPAPAPSPARTPLPCQRNRTGRGHVLLVPCRNVPCPRHSPHRGPCRTSSSAKRSGRCHLSSEGPCPSLGAPRLLPAAAAGDPQRWGAGGGSAAVPRGAGLTPRRSGGGVVPPLNPLGAKEGDSSALAPHRPHCTPQTQPEEVRRGCRGPEQGDSCDIPGCHTRPRSPPAAPGSAGGPWAALGSLTPPGHPAQSHPINRVQGSPPGTATPGGWGGRQAVISAGVN